MLILYSDGVLDTLGSGGERFGEERLRELLAGSFSNIPQIPGDPGPAPMPTPGPGGELRDIPGEVPSLVAPPAGCRFHPRCDYATAECREQRPAPRALARDHDVRCHHPVSGP